MGYPGQQGGLLGLHGLLEPSEQILLRLLVVVGEPEEQVLVLSDLLLLCPPIYSLERNQQPGLQYSPPLRGTPIQEGMKTVTLACTRDCIAVI